MFGVQMTWQFIYGITIPLLWAMIADVADFSEWTTGRRATAMTFAASLFALKLGLSLGGALQGWILESYGYVPNVEQTERAQEGICWLMSVYPAIAFLIAVVVLKFYQIDKQTENEMADALFERRKGFQTP
jgi:Na+/melibiose symporter-like transporter